MTSATITRKIGPNVLAQPLRARCGHSTVLPESRISALRLEFETSKPVAFVARLVSEIATHHARSAAAVRLQASLTRLLTHAQTQDWSLRQLAKNAVLSWSSFRRARTGNVDPIIWLPRLEAALIKLKPS